MSKTRVRVPPEYGAAYRDLEADVAASMAPREADLLRERCVICGKKPYRKPMWWVQYVDPWGEPLCRDNGSHIGGYVCSVVCMRGISLKKQREIR